MNEPLPVFVGHAIVLDATAAAVRVRRSDGEVVQAAFALPFRYTPAVSDVVLVFGQGERNWITAIVAGSGRSELAFRGDVGLCTDGALTLRGDGGVRLHAPTIGVQADSLEVEANDVVQKLAEHDAAIDSSDERCGEAARTIDGDDVTVAGTVERTARRTVRIDGDLLQLG